MNRDRTAGRKKSVCLLAALLLVSSALIYREYLFGGSYFVFVNMEDIGGDTGQQYLMVFVSIINHIREGNFSLWDFSNGLGVNMFQYNLLDPSLLLVYLVGVLRGADRIMGVLIYVQILRILAAGLFMYLFLSAFALSERAKVFAAYIYGLNGFLMVWGQHYQFGMASVYLPLILWAAERSIKERRLKAALPLTVFLEVLCSAYFSYMCCLTAGIYLLFRLAYEEKLSFRERFLQLVRVCGGMLLGIGLGLFALLPSAYVIFGVSSRMEISDSLFTRLAAGFIPYPLTKYFTVLCRLFSSVLQGIQSVDYTGYSNYYEDPQLFASVFNVLLGTQFFFVVFKKKLSARKKAVLAAGGAFALFCMTFPLAGIIYNGCSGWFGRYTFALMPFFALMTAWTAEHVLNGGKISRLLLLADAALLLRIYGQGYLGAADGTLKGLILALGIVGVLSAAVLFAMASAKKPGARRRLFAAVLLLTAADMCLEGVGTVTDRYPLAKTDTTVLPELYNSDVAEALSYLAETDEEFYRVEKTYPEALLCLSSMWQGYYGVSTYNSTINGNLVRFMELCRPQIWYLDRNHYRYSNVALDADFGAFLGVRYLLSKGNEVPEGYSYVRSFGEILLYKCDQEASPARFYGDSQVISEESFEEKVSAANAAGGAKESLREIDGLLLETLGLPGGGDAAADGRETASGTAVLYEEANGSLSGTASADGDGWLLFTIPYEKGWTVLVDGEEAETVRGSIGFTAVRLTAGTHTLRLTYRTPGLYEGAAAAAVCWIGYIGYFALVRRKRGMRK